MVGIAGLLFREGEILKAGHNNGMHPTANSAALIRQLRCLFTPPAENVPLAKKVYDEGRERGLVEIAAVAMAKGHVAATVWFPKLPEEEVQGWSRGLKLAIRQPLPAAKVVGGLRWRMFKCLKGGAGLTIP